MTMNAFSKINMSEVTRLTRAGKLAEAMALLRGRAPEPEPESESESESESGSLNSGARFSASPGQLQKEALISKVFKGKFAPAFVAPGAKYEERFFANDFGRRAYKLYVPSSYSGRPVPLVIMLHGCTQSADDFAAGTRMNELAEEQTFVVAYPSQSQSANTQRCWNWFNASEQHRDRGEPSLIAGISKQIASEYSIDTTRVYVAGLSAGGAAAAIMASTYPDLFAAAGVHSGLACGVATDLPSAFVAMKGASSLPSSRSSVPTIVFHGDQDRTIHSNNADQVIAQAMPSQRLSTLETEGKAAGGISYTKTVHGDASGNAILEQWTLHGGGHAWSGGSADGTFTDPRGPDASREMLRFFFGHRLSADLTQTMGAIDQTTRHAAG